jgi:hypothetical protein
MAAKKKQRKRANKTKKPGPEPERLKIEGDPIEGFDRLVRAKPAERSSEPPEEPEGDDAQGPLTRRYPPEPLIPREVVYLVLVVFGWLAVAFILVYLFAPGFPRVGPL